jgi:predicted MFS family arabinose efflux permease
VIPAQLADVIRYVDAGLAMALALGSAWSAVLAERWDQRVRFAAFATFAFLLTSGHLDNLGQTGSWRLAVLVVAVSAALVSVAANVRQELRAREARGRRAR